MTDKIDLALEGIRPEPLGSYLKALAVLRLVSEQKDASAAGYWGDDVFHLVSELDRDALLQFFACEYAPTPLVRPWAGRQAFLGKSSGRTAREGLLRLEKSNAPRLNSFREAIAIVRGIFRKHNIETEIEPGDATNEIVTLIRAELPDVAVRWVDAAYIVGARDHTGSFSRALPPIFGTGGNEGSQSYASAYMEALCALDLPVGASPEPLAALFGMIEQRADQRPAGQFLPGRAGGPNQGPRFETGNAAPTSAWDVVLLIEGAMTWIGGASVRQAERALGRESSPFTVRIRAVGGSIATKDEQHTRGFEIWAPLWGRPAKFAEIDALIAEGRMHIGKRPARSSLEMARAATSLGIDRGIDEFVRYPIVVRYGDKAFATCAGRFSVRERRESELVGLLDAPLAHVDNAIRADKNVPARVLAARRGVSESLFEVLRACDAVRVTHLLRAIGRLDDAVAHWSGGRKIGPLGGLSPVWLECADASVELRIAAAVASIRARKNVGPLRSNLVGVDPTRPNKWATGTGQTAWRGPTLAARMACALGRRMLDGAREKQIGNPLWGSVQLSLGDIAALIDGRVFDAALEDLIHALTWIDWGHDDAHEVVRRLGWWRSQEERDPVPRVYALLKLCFWPGKLGDAHVVPEPALISLVMAGRLVDACRLAQRRLRAHGLDVVDIASSLDGLREVPLDPKRLAASLLVPVTSRAAYDSLIPAVTVSPREERAR